MKAYKTFSTRQTSQSESIPGKDMVENSAGGYVFAIDDWKRLDRFLILGTEGGTYYIGEKEFTKDNANCVLRCIQADGIRTVNRIIEISDSGRAPKNDPALFALAMCTGLGNSCTKKYALDNLQKIARTGTHLFHFISYVEQFRGWGRGLSTAIKNWYQQKPISELAFQAVKYQSRDKWSHKDLLRLSHPKADSSERNTIYKWIVDTEVIEGLHELILAFESAKKATSSKEIVKLIEQYNLPRECIPTQFLKEANIWAAMLPKMPMTAMIRNLATMTRIGLLKPMSDAVNIVISKISDKEALRKARIHPIAILSALKVYEQGRGERGKYTCNPVSQVIDALDAAFYTTFQNVESTNKYLLLALDVSGSMASGMIAGVPGLTPRVASAAMALVTAAVEKNYHIMGFSKRFIPLSISPRQRLTDAVKVILDLPFERTDCALPMLWAIKNKVNIDTFIVYTDSETWFGNIHPCQALQQYRNLFGKDAKLIVVGMTATNFSIADPNDIGMLDVVGFDTATPQIISDFVVE